MDRHTNPDEYNSDRSTKVPRREVEDLLSDVIDTFDITVRLRAKLYVSIPLFLSFITFRQSPLLAPQSPWPPARFWRERSIRQVKPHKQKGKDQKTQYF